MFNAVIRAINKLIDALINLAIAIAKNSEVVHQNSKVNVALINHIDKLSQSILILNRSVDELSDSLNPPISPVGSITFTAISEEGNKMFYRIGLPQLPPDVTQKDRDEIVRGELRLVYDGVAQTAIQTVLDQQSVDDVEIAEGVAVEGMFGYVDNAGNFSAIPVLLSPFTVTDTIPPVNPVGELTVTATGE